MKFNWWKIEQTGTPYFLVATDKFIGRINTDDPNKQAASLKAGRLPDDIYKIPFNYVTEILIQEGKRDLIVRFNKESEEVYPIKNFDQRFNIFDHLNKHTTHQGYELQKPSLIKAAKRPLIAMLIMSLLLGWSYFAAVDIESGLPSGRQPMVIAGIASLGSQMISWIYLGLMGIALIAILPKVSKPVVRHVITYN